MIFYWLSGWFEAWASIKGWRRLNVSLILEIVGNLLISTENLFLIIIYFINVLMSLVSGKIELGHWDYYLLALKTCGTKHASAIVNESPKQYFPLTSLNIFSRAVVNLKFEI